MGKIIFFAGWLLLLGGTAWAESCLEGNCKDGHGTFQWDDGSKFTGNFVNGAPDGQGLYTDPSGREYIVTYQDGQPLPPKHRRPRRPNRD